MIEPAHSDRGEEQLRHRTSTKNYLWIGQEMAEERDVSNNVTKRLFPQGEQQSGTSYYYYTRDHLFSIRELMDSSGNIVSRVAYDPYGKRTFVSGVNFALFGYAGTIWHQPSGIDLTEGGVAPSTGRPYDPNTGRWLSRDPLKDAETLLGPNLYEYGNNDP